MPIDETRLITLLRSHLAGGISAEDAAELQEWFMQVDADEFNRLMDKMQDRLPEEFTALHEVSAGFSRRLEERVDEAEAMEREEEVVVVPVHRVHLLRRAWAKYPPSLKLRWAKYPPSLKLRWAKAAAAIIIIGIGAYLWNIKKDELHETTASSEARSAKEDVAPGGNKAVLTLADGSHIILDSAANGKIAQQGAALIEKKDGQVVYSSSSVIPSEARNLVFNTLSTPRGGQYQLTLPDGTQVWLNAESSITYPTAFIGKERKVTITGEAYFEVAKNKTKKFIVNVDGKQEVEVLGTQFNINAYKDENAIKTTLIEGSVKLTSAALSAEAGTAKAGLRETKLKPGEQAVLTIVDSRLPASAKVSADKSIVDSRLSIVTSPDLDQVLAWKNGLFNFNNMKLKDAMKQIAKWYDVEVVYEQNPKDMTFGGMIGRDLNLSQVLKVLKVAGVRYKIEGKELIVTN